MAWHLLAVGVFLLAFVRPAQAQFLAARGPERTGPGEELALYLHWRGQNGVEGWIVELPAGWLLRDAALIDVQRLAALPVTLEGLGGPGRRYRITAQARVRGGFDLVLTLQSGRRLGPVEVKIRPFVWEPTSGRVRTRTLDDDLFVRPVVVGTPVDGGSNRALYLQGGQAMPIADSRASGLFEPGPFTVELWLKTTARDAVVLSTWSGEERESYPLELLTDLRGRLTWYWGQPGWHQSLTTDVPVADGAWHHLAVVRDPDRSAYRLYVDGSQQDSLHATAGQRNGFDRSLVLGARPRGASGPGGAAPAGGFAGWMDELRIWKAARNGGEIRRHMNVPLRSAGRDRYVMGFHAEPSARTEAIGNGAIRPTDLALLMPIGELRARLETGMVELEWTVDSGPGQTFVVERSRDGFTFEQVGLVRQGAGSGNRVYRFSDAPPMGPGGVWTYRIRQVYDNGVEQTSGSVKVGLGPGEPISVRLLGNSPNPFTTRTQITVDVETRQYVRLSVWGLSGHPVALLVDRELEQGHHTFSFEAIDLPSGLYFAVMDVEGGQQTVKMTLMN